MSEGSPSSTRSPREPSQTHRPPVVWLSGELNGVTDRDLTLRLASDGRVTRVRRLAGDATAFLERSGDDWTALPDVEALLLEVGTPVCVDALDDRGGYFALRIYVGVRCGPLPS